MWESRKNKPSVLITFENLTNSNKGFHNIDFDKSEEFNELKETAWSFLMFTNGPF